MRGHFGNGAGDFFVVITFESIDVQVEPGILNVPQAMAQNCSEKNCSISYMQFLDVLPDIHLGETPVYN